MEEVGLRLIGSVNYFQRDKLTGLIVPGTEVVSKNTIVEDLGFYLAYKIGTNTINQSLSNRFTVGGTIGVGDNGYDGIAYGTSTISGLTHKLDTDINAGGTLAESYIEFSGNIDGPLSLAGYLQLGHNYSVGAFSEPYAYYAITTTVETGRTFYFYWRLTVT
jgi:hypothetical protein